LHVAFFLGWFKWIYRAPAIDSGFVVLDLAAGHVDYVPGLHTQTHTAGERWYKKRKTTKVERRRKEKRQIHLRK